MKDYSFISMLPGLLMVVFGIMAQSYWMELRKYRLKMPSLKGKKEKKTKSSQKYQKVILMFRLICAAALLCLVAWFIPVFLPTNVSIMITKYVLASIGFIFLAFLVVVISGKYFFSFDAIEKFLKAASGKFRVHKFHGNSTAK